MITDFSILHRRKPLTFASNGGDYPLWSTCLRSLLFAPSVELSESHSGDELYTHQEAYQFLLEIVCGLHSPIAGETEVFGQFKVFAQEWAKREPMRRGLIQALLNDAKSLRAQHLNGLGSQSYGGWIRKNLKSRRVHIVGGGSLVREILPYLSKQNREIVVHVREPGKMTPFAADVRVLARREFDHGALLIAAPVSAGEISDWLGPLNVEQLFDLRDNSDSDVLRTSGERFILQDVFQQIESTKARMQPKIEEVRLQIRLLAAKAAEHSLLRPKGWDDLCA